MGTLDKYCPLLDKESGSAKCMGDECAWWIKDGMASDCAINSLVRASYQLEEIKRRNNS